MAYGHTRQGLLRRAIPLAVAPLTTRKVEALQQLRERFIMCANLFVEGAVAGIGDPLFNPASPRSLDALMTPKQREITGLNKAYVEKARLAAKEKLLTRQQKYFEQLHQAVTGCHRRGTRRALARLLDVSEETLKTLSLWARALSLGEFLARLREELAGSGLDAINADQHVVLRCLHRDVFARLRWPTFGRDRHFTCQIHLDYRLVPAGEYAPLQASFTEEARLLCDDENRRYQSFLDLSNPTPRAPRIRVPVALPAAVLEQHAKGVAPASLEVNSFVLEIGARSVGVKAMLCQPLRPPRAIEECSHIIGRDYGYTNTVTLAVVKADVPIEAGRMETLRALNKEEMKTFLQTHHHPTMNAALVLRFNGQRFQGLLEKDSERIAQLSSEISQITEKTARRKAILNGAQGRDHGAYVERDQRPHDSLLAGVHERLFRGLDARRALMRKRDDLWAKRRATKRCWFGHIANRERDLALKYHAALVRETLSIGPIARESVAYKGRAFNRMMSRGARSHYERIASEKLRWAGLSEYNVQSAYTSSTCVKHARVEGSQRCGARFRCMECEHDRHADENAALTLACLPLLQPI